MGIQILENNKLKVSIADHGSELISVYDKENNIERMWNADPTIWNRHAPILFPFVGKVSNGSYRWNGQEYKMATQHGFARDKEFECVCKDGKAVTQILRADEETYSQYPFSFELRVTHRFSSENERMLEVIWEVYNHGNEDMYYAIGGHPGFAVPVAEKQTREQYYLEIPGKEKLRYILLNPRTGLAVPEQKYSLNLEEGFYAIQPNLFDTDALLFEDGQIDLVRIVKPDKTPCVTLHCEGFPYVGIWSKPNGNFVCLEPWYGRTDDDGFQGNLEEKPGIQMLRPNEHKIYLYQLEFHK